MKFFLIIINVILTNGLILFGNNIMPIRSVNDVTEGAFLVRNEEENSYKLIPTINTDVKIDIKGINKVTEKSSSNICKKNNKNINVM